MNQIQKHSFEAVSLLTAENGLLNLTVIPAINQPDWLIPTDLILSVDDYHERIWTYLWNNQEVAVYHLVPRDMQPDKLIVLEGNTDVHRIALQTKGTLHKKAVRISDVKDADLPPQYQAVDEMHTPPIHIIAQPNLESIQTEANQDPTDDLIYDDMATDDLQNLDLTTDESLNLEETSNLEADLANLDNPEDKPTDTPSVIQVPYVFQSVEIEGQIYLVPDLDRISHRLVDLDG